jgi:hypothetical protein
VSVPAVIAPFALDLTGTGIAWTAWVMAVATVLVGASLRLGRDGATTA